MNKLQELVEEIHKMTGIGKITLTERIQALLHQSNEKLLGEIEKKVIGEDENERFLSYVSVAKTRARNQLRAEQRKALSDVRKLIQSL